MNRAEIDIVTADRSTTIRCRCDGAKIEETVAHEGLFIVKEITPLYALEQSERYAAAARQMLGKTV